MSAHGWQRPGIMIRSVDRRSNLDPLEAEPVTGCRILSDLDLNEDSVFVTMIGLQVFKCLLVRVTARAIRALLALNSKEVIFVDAPLVSDNIGKPPSAWPLHSLGIVSVALPIVFHIHGISIEATLQVTGQAMNNRAFVSVPREQTMIVLFEFLQGGHQFTLDTVFFHHGHSCAVVEAP